MSEPGKFVIVFEPSEDGYGAFVPELAGCITVGDTLQEAKRNMQEAIAGHIEAMRAHGEEIPAKFVC
jgi:predicted RNase H-like HicB family nuclease